MSCQLQWHQQLSGMTNVIHEWAHELYLTVWLSYCACNALPSQQACIDTLYCMSCRSSCLQYAEPSCMPSKMSLECTARASCGSCPLTYSQRLFCLLDACISPSLESEVVRNVMRYIFLLKSRHLSADMPYCCAETDHLHGVQNS